MMGVAVQSDQRLWTRELKAANDVQRLIVVLVQQVAVLAAAEGMDEGCVREPDEPCVMSADLIGEVVTANHEGRVWETTVRIVERLRDVR